MDGDLSKSGFERCLGSATTLSFQRPSSFCHPDPDFLLRLVASWAGRSGAHEWRTADPLASLGMTKRRGSLEGKGCCKERVVARKEGLLNRGIFQNLIRTGLHPLRIALKSKVAQPRVVVGAPSDWPAKLALRLLDRQVIDAGVPRVHQTFAVKLPIFVAISTKPTA
jgi:hypothetical protein